MSNHLFLSPNKFCCSSIKSGGVKFLLEHTIDESALLIHVFKFVLEHNIFESDLQYPKSSVLSQLGLLQISLNVFLSNFESYNLFLICSSPLSDSVKNGIPKIGFF